MRRSTATGYIRSEKAAPRLAGAVAAPMRVVCAIALMVSAGIVGAEDHAEILYVIEVDEVTLTGGAGVDVGDTASFLPGELAARLAEAVTIDVQLFEPVAAIPYPSIVITVIGADGEPAGRRWLEYGEDYAPAGGYRFGLPPGAQAALADLIGDIGLRSLTLIATEDLGYYGGDRRLGTAVSEPARVLAELQADDAEAAVCAISIVAVPRTVETFVAEAGKGGGFAIILRSAAPSAAGQRRAPATGRCRTVPEVPHGPPD